MKKFVIALMAFSLVISLAGCGGGGGSGPSTVEMYESQPSLSIPEEYNCGGENGIQSNLDKMANDFKSATKTASEKKETLGKYISNSFKRADGSGSRDELLNVMGSRFERYKVIDWGFKVTNHSKNDEEIKTTCSIRLNLEKKPGKEGRVDHWNDAILNKELVWKKESEVWKIIRGFPYERGKDL